MALTVKGGLAVRDSKLKADCLGYEMSVIVVVWAVRLGKCKSIERLSVLKQESAGAIPSKKVEFDLYEKTYHKTLLIA